jgi:outer membrane protein
MVVFIRKGDREMKIRTLVIVLGILFLVPAIWSQVNGPAAPSPSKVGTISVQALIANTAEGKRASSELQSQFAARSAELQNLQKQIEELQAKLQSGPALNEGERERLQRQGDRLTHTFQRKQQSFQDDLNFAQQEVINNIGRKLVNVLGKYSKEKGYSVILDTSSQQSPVVYGAPQIDVTQDILRIYDQSHPAKTATAPPSKPATPEATPTPPTKP